MAASAGSLAKAISVADQHQSVLDDKVDFEDHATLVWLRSHQLKGYAHHRAVIGTDTLSTAWSAQKKKFIDLTAATTYLHHFAHSPTALTSIQTLAHSLSMVSGTLTDQEAQTVVATALVNGRAWLIETPRHDLKSRFVTKTSPSAFAPINPKLGTNVDFTFIAKLEGDQWLRGYVPFKKGGVVAGKSGMTIASGFDLGQWYADDFTTKMNLPKTLVDKLSPFADRNFKGLNRAQVAAQIAKIGPVPVIEKPEADLCDGAVFYYILKGAKSSFDDIKGKRVISFTALPSGWQTVWLSRFYQEGPAPRSAQANTFRDLVRAGKWKDAVAALRAYKEYADRAGQEADLLAKQMPPDPVVDKPKVP